MCVSIRFFPMILFFVFFLLVLKIETIWTEHLISVCVCVHRVFDRSTIRLNFWKKESRFSRSVSIICTYKNVLIYLKIQSFSNNSNVRRVNRRYLHNFCCCNQVFLIDFSISTNWKCISKTHDNNKQNKKTLITNKMNPYHFV